MLKKLIASEITNERGTSHFMCSASSWILAAFGNEQYMPKIIIPFLIKTATFSKFEETRTLSILTLKKHKKLITDRDRLSICQLLKEKSISNESFIGLLFFLRTDTPQDFFEKLNNIIKDNMSMNSTDFLKDIYNLEDSQLKKNILDSLRAVVANINSIETISDEGMNVIKLIVELEPTCPDWLMSAFDNNIIERKINDEKYFHVLGLIAKSGGKFKDDVIQSLGRVLNKAGAKISNSVAFILSSIAANGQSLPNDTLKALNNFILNIKPQVNNQIFLHLSGRLEPASLTLSKPAMAALEKQAKNFPTSVDDIERNVILLFNIISPQKYNARCILKEIARGRGNLLPKTIEKLVLLTVGEERKLDDTFHCSSASILKELNLSNHFEYFRNKKFVLEVLADALYKTPLDSILSSNVFNTEQKSYLITNRLNKVDTALFLQNDKLAYFLDGQLYEITLRQEEIKEIFCEIRATTKKSDKLAIFHEKAQRSEQTEYQGTIDTLTRLITRIFAYTRTAIQGDFT